MPLYYKCDILELLRSAGYSSYRLTKEKLLSPSTLQKLRDKEPISWDNIERLCSLLDCQPSEIIGYKKEGK